MKERQGGQTVHECILTNILLDLDNKVILWMLAAKGKDCCLSGFDGQRGYLSFRNDLTSVRWQSWGPRLYEDCNVASMWQSNLVSF